MNTVLQYYLRIFNPISLNAGIPLTVERYPVELGPCLFVLSKAVRFTSFHQQPVAVTHRETHRRANRHGEEEDL